MSARLLAMKPPPSPAAPGPDPARRPVRKSFSIVAAPVREVLAAARQRAADRQNRQASEPAHAADAAAPGDRRLRCRACGRMEHRSADQLRRLVRAGWPECCGRPMPPADGPAPAAADPGPGSVMLSPPGAQAAVRRGLVGAGPDLTLELLDVLAGGVRVRLAEPVARREEVEVALSAAAGPRAVRLPAVVAECRASSNGTFVAELRFRHALPPDTLAALTGRPARPAGPAG